MKASYKEFIKKVPILKSIAAGIGRAIRGEYSFVGSKQYWEERYKRGGTSGAGSYGRLAEFKAELLNEFVKRNNIKTVIEFGCGDGHQLSLAKYPAYIGLDVSRTAVEICRKKFEGDPTKEFLVYDGQKKINKSYSAELTLSLDVIYHLVEDAVFDTYMENLFRSSSLFVIIYASNIEGEQRYHHEKTRDFTSWINKSVNGWVLEKRIANLYPHDSSNPEETSQSDFFIYTKTKLAQR